MPYHTPDPIWTIYVNATKFDRYTEHFVVPGRFHQLVPPEVSKAYETVEYLMAHAWYHYPMLDEALAKLLRVLEMAVKLRCDSLGLKVTGKNFQQLIDMTFPASTVNEFNDTMHWLRYVRNELMHPKPKNLFGGAALTHIRQCITLLNALFLPEQYFQNAQTTLEYLRKQCQPFEKGSFLLEYEGKRILIYRAILEEVYFFEDDWLVLCAFHTIPVDFTQMLKNNRFPRPIVCLLRGIQIEGTTLHGSVGTTGQSFVLSLSKQPDDIAEVAAFEQEKMEISAVDASFCQATASDEIYRIKVEARYIYWSL